MVGCFIIIGLAIILICWYIISKYQKYDLKELLIKTSISFLFVIVALIATLESSKFTIFNVLVISGLLLGLIGDILLDLKYVDIERTTGYTYGGFISFGIGHILFVTALIINYYQAGGVLYIILPIIASIVLSIVTILLEKPLKLKYGKYKIISLFYAFLLFGTVTFSLSLSIQNGFQVTALTMFLIGSISFTLSDLVLSGTFFGENKERIIDFVLNYVFYYGAQFTIAMLLLFI